MYNAWGADEGFRLRDIDRDGICELIVGTPFLSAIFKRNVAENRWVKLPYALPRGTSIIDASTAIPIASSVRRIASIRSQRSVNCKPCYTR